MTFILTIKTDKGIILAADSKELLQGGYLQYDDFSRLLKKKHLKENSRKPSLSPAEIGALIQKRSKLTGGRIRSIDGAKKIFRVTDDTAILIAGKADPGGKDFAKTIKKIQQEVSKSPLISFDDILRKIFSGIETLFENDADDKLDSQYIFCGYDKNTHRFRTIKFFFDDKVISDGQNGWVKNSDGSLKKVKYFRKAEDPQILVSGGLTQYIRELAEFNKTNASMSLTQAFEVCQKVLDLAVTLENIVHKIPAIGGEISYAMITENGFTWIINETDILNCVESD
jgi:hypothetical protein